MTLMFASVVIGAIPRMGKTFLLRLFLLIAALDPRAELHAFDFKGTGDLGPVCEPVCHRYRAGDDDEDIVYVLESLRELQDGAAAPGEGDPVPAAARAARRSRSPPSWPVTRRLGLHPIVAGVDECQSPVRARGARQGDRSDLHRPGQARSGRWAS